VIVQHQPSHAVRPSHIVARPKRTENSRRCLMLARAAVLCALAACSLAGAPAQTPPPAKHAIDPARVDIYGGYGYLLPFDSGIGIYAYDAVGNLNATSNVSYFFTRHLGVMVEGDYFSGNSTRRIPDQCTPACSSRDQLAYSAEAGPVYRFTDHRFTPFVHALVGAAKINGPYDQPLTWGPAFKGGGGVDWVLPHLHHYVAWRLFQADLEYSVVNYGPLVAQGQQGGTAKLSAFKLSTGLVLRFGDMTPPPVLTLSCTVQPDTVFPGDPVSLVATPAGVNPKKKMVFTWASSGGQVDQPSSTATTVHTNGLAPGLYKVTGHATEGTKAIQEASCDGSFTVRAYDPPTISCTASPATVGTGEPSTITAAGLSPQNRTLTYSYTTSSGQISGTGTTATLTTAGLAPGSIEVTCAVTDDQGKTATSQTSVSILPPPPVPVVVAPRDLCSVDFTRDKKRPRRVDNEAKACLDDVALTMNRESDARLVLVGTQSEGEPDGTAATRSFNVKAYLTEEKGIEPNRIELRTGTAPGDSVNSVLLPPGAVYPDSAGVVVDPASLGKEHDPYGKKRAPRKH
jgi:hypothetical protein